MTYVLLDTNILIYDPYVVKKLVRRNCYVVIPVMVIDELDKLKMRNDLKQNITRTGQVIEEIINEKKILSQTPWKLKMTAPNNTDRMSYGTKLSND